MALEAFPLLLPHYDSLDRQVSEPYKSAYDHSVRQWSNAAFEEAERDQQESEELSLLGGYMEYLSGKQWTSSRPSYKSKPVNNRMIRLFWELVGQLTDIRPIAEVRSTKSIAGDEDEPSKRVTKMLNDGLRAWALMSQFDLKLAECIAFAVLTTSFAKIQWNSTLNFGRGELEMVPVGPTELMPLKASRSLESAEALIYKVVRPLRWFRQVYPGRGALVKPDERYSNFQVAPTLPGTVSPMLFKTMNEGMRRKLTGSPVNKTSAVPMAEYREFWIRDETRNTYTYDVRMGEYGMNWSYIVPPGQPLYPRGRLICMGGPHVILHDGPNPYWHGSPPFAMLRLNIVPWQFYGLSDLRPQVPLQDIINNILAGVLDAVKKAVNPTFMAPSNALSEQVWQTFDWSLPGARMKYSPQSVHRPEFAPVPQLPGFVLAMMQAVEREMDQHSTGALTAELAKKKQVPSGEGIDQLKAEKMTPIRLKGRNIESFIQTCGNQMVSNIIQFWDAKKRLTMLGTQGLTFEDFDWDPGTMVPFGVSRQEFVKDFEFFIEPGSLLSIKRVEEKTEAIMLRRMGALSLKGLYRKLGGAYDVNLIERELIEEMQILGALPKPQKGGGARK
jgi:hypothetical protein